MLGLGGNGYTDEQVLRALRGEVGTRRFEFVYHLLDENNQVVRVLPTVLSGSVTHDGLADIKRTAKFQITEDPDGEPIDFLRHRVKPYARLVMPPLPEPGGLLPGGTYDEVAAVVRNKLARWPMDELEGPTSADVVAGHDLVVSGPVTVNWSSQLASDGDGRALRFDGDGAIAVCNDARSFLGGVTALSIAMWIKPFSVGETRTLLSTTAANTWGSYLSSTWDQVGTLTWNDFESELQAATWDAVEASGLTWGELGTWDEPVRPVGGLSVTLDGATKSYQTSLRVGGEQVTGQTPTNTQEAQQVQFLVITWVSGGPVRMYLDGEQVSETPSDVVGGLEGIGALNFGALTGGFTGCIDDTLIAADVLSPALIRALYVAGAGIGPSAHPDQQFVQWPLGVFLLSSPTRALNDTGTVVRDVEAFDQGVILDSQKVSATYYVAEGDLYSAAITELLANTVGLGEVVVTPSDKVLPAQKVWDAGTSHLTILNDLTTALGYEALHFDADGAAVVRPHIPPDTRQPEYDYIPGEVSVLFPDVTEELDLFAAPNQWVLIVSEPDRSLLRSVYTNADPSSPTSTVNRGRVITEFHAEQDAADQSVLDAKVQQLAQEAGARFEQVKFSTALMPIHAHRDVYRVAYPDLGIDGVYDEVAWSFNLEAGSAMQHTARRAARSS